MVALIVKMDDIGLHLAAGRLAPLRAIGRGLVLAMPVLMKVLSVVGTAAMIWVGGGILLHGLEAFGFTALPHAVHHFAEEAGHAAPIGKGAVAWIVGAAGSGILGLAVGGFIVAALHLSKRLSGGSAAPH